jgi:hypothetical protein
MIAKDLSPGRLKILHDHGERGFFGPDFDDHEKTGAAGRGSVGWMHIGLFSLSCDSTG